MSLLAKVKDFFDIEKKIDRELRERVDVVTTQVFADIDKVSPVLGGLLTGDPVELDIHVTLQLKPK